MQAVDATKIACPTLLVTGDEDVVAPPQSVRSMKDRLAQTNASVDVEVLRGCGHWTPIEMPEECAGILRRFLEQRR
jgi:pimeloyl-ACP methyl ester carboxylesterase